MSGIILVLLTSGVFYSCEKVQGLTPPTAVLGNVVYTGSWPDSIQAAALVVLKGLDEENLGDLIVSYSNPDYPGTESSEYFFQLEPGYYFIAAVGLIMDPGLFFTHLDSVLALENLPLVILDKTPLIQTGFRIYAQNINKIDQEIIF